MPFTVSHAAVVLPFTRLLARRRLLSAVVIGAMVPDFGVFFPWKVARGDTHSAMGLVTFCLPLGLATYWVFQYVVKRPIFELLPDGAYARWRAVSSRASIANIRQWLLAASGVIAGAVSHLVLDAFTHEGARGVRMLPMLDEPIVEYGGHYLRGVRLMQDGLSLLGLAMVFALVWYGLRHGAEHPVQGRALPAPARHRWVVIYIVTAVAVSVAWFVFERFHRPGMNSPTMIAALIAVSGLRGTAAALLGVSVALRRRLRESR
ncbi:MAG: DUF4184 family protein [Pseudomonadota bacterium]|nr:DUF4184 family protein [Pseudomonadota bacterium]